MPRAQPAAPTYEGFQRVQKNRNAAIHWLLQLTHRIEKEWANEDSRMADLQLLKQCLGLPSSQARGRESRARWRHG